MASSRGCCITVIIDAFSALPDKTTGLHELYEKRCRAARVAQFLVQRLNAGKHPIQCCCVSGATRALAIKHNRPFLHIDLKKLNVLKAADRIANWILQHGIKALNVAGPRGSKEPDIYQAVKRVLTTVLYLDHIRTHMPDPERLYPHLPRPERCILKLGKVVRSG